MQAVGEGVSGARLWIPLAAVWAVTAAGVVVAVAQPATGRPVALALVLALSVVAGMVSQLAVGEQRGFVIRFAAGSGGSLVLVLLGVLAAALHG